MRPQKRFLAAICALAAFGVVLPACLAIALVPPDLKRMKRVRTVEQAVDLFKKAGFDPQAALRRDVDEIPPVFLATLPRDLDGLSDIDLRKAVFVSIVLPHVLRANARIRHDRQRLARIVAARRDHERVSQNDRRWLRKLADRYDTEPTDTKTLLRRVDVVPPRLAVAQAAQESGWGTSRFARAGNALFGQHASDGATDAVSARKADGVALHAFDTLYGSVRGYIHNLNTHRAYRRFRAMRAQMRARGERLDGHALAATLGAYSEEGAKYVDRLRRLMELRAVAASRGTRLAPVE